MPWSHSSATHAGVRRQNNEDSCCVRPDLGLFVVADGVGGYAAGEVASGAAVAAIEQAVAETAGRDERSRWPFDYQPALGVEGNRLHWAFHQANVRIRTEAEAGRGRHGMATTVAAVLLGCGPDGVSLPVRGATIGHVGDSRIYRYRPGDLDRLTRDHSWVEEQVQAGFISAREARHHPRRNLLTRALTGSADPVADLAWVPVGEGDSLLICTDGLYSVVHDEQIAAILGRYDDPDEAADEPFGACDALVHAANLAGGPDNITVILIRL
jgi:serine/threonine protein phosphatase PrpC